MKEYTPAPIAAARAILSGRRPPAFCDPYLPRMPGEMFVRSEGCEWLWNPAPALERAKWANLHTRWGQEASVLGGFEEMVSLARGEVQALQRLLLEALDDILRLYRDLGELGLGESNPLQRFDRYRLKMRLAVMLREEIADLAQEWNDLAAADGPYLNPDHELRRLKAESVQQRAMGTTPKTTLYDRLRRARRRGTN